MNIMVVMTFLISMLLEPLAAVAALVTVLFIGLSLVSIISDALTADCERGE